MTPQFLTPAELCKRWREGVTVRTLRHWRKVKQGPPFGKFGREVLYPIDRLVEWENRQVKS